MKYFAAISLLSLSSSLFAQSPQNHPCISRDRTAEIYEEYRTKHSEARLGQRSFDMLRALYREADPKIVTKINARKSLTEPELRAFRAASIRAIRSVAPASVTCDDDTAECRDNVPGNSILYRINYSDHDNVLSFSTKADISIPAVQNLGLVPGTYTPKFNVVSNVSVRDGRIEELAEAVEPIFPYNSSVDLPAGAMFWSPIDRRMLDEMQKNSIAYCEQRERRLSEESGAVNSSERGLIEDRGRPSSSPRSGTPGGSNVRGE